MSFRSFALIAVGGVFAAGALGLASSPAHAAANLIVNGDFEQVTGVLTSDGTPTGTQQSGRVNSSDVTGWSGSGLIALYTPGTADTTGAPLGSPDGTVRLWGSKDGGTTVLPATSPTGGNFIAMDGDSKYGGPLSTTVNGLTVGQNYALTFWMAGAQETNNNGATTEAFSVTLGSQTLSTGSLSTPSHGFSNWVMQTLTFTASAASSTLTFLAVGTPSGAPPMSLLDGVSLVAAPEPATWAVMIVGLVGVTVLARRSRGKGVSSTAV